MEIARRTDSTALRAEPCLQTLSVAFMIAVITRERTQSDHDNGSRPLTPLVNTEQLIVIVSSVQLLLSPENIDNLSYNLFCFVIHQLIIIIDFVASLLL